MSLSRLTRSDPGPAAFLAAVLALGMASCGGGGGPQPAAVTRMGLPDVVLITLDTTRADHLGVYGGQSRVSPHLDRLAAQGTAFMACDTASPLTLPSHATLLSGLYPTRHGMRTNGSGRLGADLPFLPQWLARHGYQTGAFISSAVLDRRHGLDRGFDIYDDQVGAGAEQRGDITVDKALAWWQERDARPAFLWVHLFDAHAPYRPPVPYAQQFAGNPYDGELAFMDAQAGRLLAGLTAPGPGRLVAVIGDHGEGLGEHGEKEHGLLLYQSTLAVPWILAGAGVPAAQQVTAPVRTIDLLPTLLARTTVPTPGGLPGRDVLAAGQTPDRSYAETYMPWADYGWHPLHALRQGEHKLIQGAYPSLYDLGSDPHELRNLLAAGPSAAPTPAMRARAHEMESSLHTLRAERVTGTPPPPEESPVQPLDRLRSLGYLAGVAGEPPALDALLDPRGQTSFHEQVRQALAAYGDTDYDQAAIILGGLLRQQAGNPFLQDLAGSVAMARGRHKEAIALFSAALSHSPDRAPVEIHLAEALLAAGRPAAAEQRCRHALTNLPTPPPVRAALLLCRAISLQGRAAEAARRASQFLAETNDPSNPLLEELVALAGETALRSSTP